MPPYYYQFTFLPPGNYTVAFTCQADKDNLLIRQIPPWC